jgi:hypothetical protein
MNLPVVAIAVLTAAVAQDFLPGTPQGSVKVEFLSAAGLYFAMTKPPLVALTALVWAGALTDALGGLPLFCTCSFLLLMYAATRLLQRVFLEPTPFHGALLMAVASVAQGVWTRLWVATGTPVFAWRTLEVLGWELATGLVAGLVGFAVCGLADRLSGNVKPVKEGNGILWSETDR